MKLDLYDKKILYELDWDTRQSNKQIAKKVGLSEQVTGNRIKRLIENKIIDYFYVKTNPSTLGYFHIKFYLRMHNITNEKYQQLIQELKSETGVFWLVTLRGKYDIEMSLHVKNIAEFSQRYQQIFQKWELFILERKILFLEKAFTYTPTYLWPKQKKEEILYTKSSEEKAELDETDIKLLKQLNLNGRKSLVELARELNISADTVNYRIKHMEKIGVITGFGAKINFQEMGNSYSIICLKMQNMNAEKYLKLETWAKFNPQIIVLVKALGDHEIEIEAITSNKEELGHIIKTLRDGFVAEIKDYEILEVIKEERLTYFPF
ncbi:MAG TPA: Lrp/AsnC family transcriptional regulator [Candidatus Nanoarchaeia archaeon]|nr:Lrp/AsnC family transcriptional regulator [Candidatus Nanoarchaeia archaeon]